MKNSSTWLAGALLCAATSSQAALVFEGGTAPALIDPTKEAVYFTETMDQSGVGVYTVTNNTTDSYLTAIGISNVGALAWIGTPGQNFGCYSTWCYSSKELDASNWATEMIDYDGNTGMDIFGDIGNVLDPGDNMINFYMAEDGELGPGDSWDGFLFTNAAVNSQMFVILSGPGGSLYASGGQPLSAVPVPAAIWLFGSGLLGLVGIARRKQAG